MEHLTVFKIITDNEFIPLANYEFIDDRKHYKINCIKETSDGGWYFSTEISQDEIQEIFEQPYARLKSETGTFKITDLEKKFLKFIGSRESLFKV